MQKKLTFEEKLAKHPSLKARLETILDLAENELLTADDAEEKAIIELRKLGQEVMMEWATSKASKETATYRIKNPRAHSHKKKASPGTQPSDSSQ